MAERLGSPSTYVTVHGAGGSAWEWHLVAAELQERGHDVVAVDLPCEDERAGWSEYADAVVEAVGDRPNLVVVAHSLGAFTAPIVCTRLPVDLLVLVAAMIPAPGETANDWWANSGWAESERGQVGDDDLALYLHDVPGDLAEEALRRSRDQAVTPMQEPWPLESWPDVATRYLVCRDDRMFPAEWARRHARERLGVTADEIDGSHCVYLSRPRELAERLDAYRVEV
jgi:pimeloyl-ACP methyl ester carboxylesterase